MVWNDNIRSLSTPIHRRRNRVGHVGLVLHVLHGSGVFPTRVGGV